MQAPYDSRGVDIYLGHYDSWNDNLRKTNVYFMVYYSLLLGAYFEERELINLNDETYNKYVQLIPNRLIPNLSVLFMKEETLNDMRAEIYKGID